MRQKMFPLSCSSVPENDNYRSFRFVCRFPRRYCLVLPSVLFCFLWFVSFLLLCQQRSSTREWLAIWGLCSLLKIAYQDFSLLWGGSLEHESAPGKRKVHQRAWLSPAKKSGTWTERNGTVKEPNETLYFFDAYCTYCFDHGSFPESYF